MLLFAQNNWQSISCSNIVSTFELFFLSIWNFSCANWTTLRTMGQVRFVSSITTFENRSRRLSVNLKDTRVGSTLSTLFAYWFSCIQWGRSTKRPLATNTHARISTRCYKIANAKIYNNGLDSLFFIGQLNNLLRFDNRAYAVFKIYEINSLAKVLNYTDLYKLT